MNPKYYNCQGKAVFTTSQIDYLGAPEANGFTDPYYVIESREDIKLMPSFHDEQRIKKDIHRYSRILRFKTTLGQLVGAMDIKTSKSLAKIDQIKNSLSNFDRDFTPPCMIWELIRSLLKKHGLNQFYNRIPIIAKILGMQNVTTKITTKQWNLIMEDFIDMDEIFKRIRHKVNRKYFPSLRFIALALLKRHGVTLALTIPIARTALKKRLLFDVYDELWGSITDEYEDYLINI